MATIEKVTFSEPIPKLKKVAAYARVSSGKDEMLHSLSAQVSAYSRMIQNHKGWQYAGVYADTAKTGTKDSRENFQRLMEDCRAGKINMVITKSISRFARNTVTLLSAIRELRAIGVDVFFEEQNIHSVSTEGEVLLTLLAGFAQEESRSVSENQKWRIRKNFEEGKPWDGTLLGYRLREGSYVIEPTEAETVRRIYHEYLSGKGVVTICNALNADGIKTRFGNGWHPTTVSQILRNDTYTGNLLLQKTYRNNHLEKKTLINDGALPMYRAEGTHEAIVSMEDFEAVQAEMARRAAIHAPKDKTYTNRYPYSSLIVCAHCGKHYRRKVTHSGPVWICPTYNQQGKAACPSKAVPEPVLDSLTADMDWTELTAIRAEDGNRLVFCQRDGTETVQHWKDRSRAESWTPEMKEAARQNALKRNRS